MLAMFILTLTSSRGYLLLYFPAPMHFDDLSSILEESILLQID